MANGTLEDALQRLDDETFNRMIAGIQNVCDQFMHLISDDCPACQIKFELARIRGEQPKAEAA